MGGEGMIGDGRGGVGRVGDESRGEGEAGLGGVVKFSLNFQKS